MQVVDRQTVLDESQGVLRRMLSETLAEADELEALRGALRECRQRLHRSALESTRRIVALNSSVVRMEALTHAQQSRIENLEADLALLGAPPCPSRWQHERWPNDNAAMHNAAHSLWTLKKNLGDAHAEYGKLAEERDRLALLCAELREQLSDPSRAPSSNRTCPQSTNQ